jgi:hypothetical protein
MVKTGRAALSAALAGALVVAVVAFVVTADPPQSQVPYANAQVGELNSTVVTADPSVAGSAVAAGVARNVLILGDSAMVDASPAIAAAFTATGANAVMAASPGVGLTTDPAVFDWRHEYAQLVADHQPDLVVMMIGAWDIGYLKDNGPDAYLEVVDEAVDVLTAGGARVLWVSMPPGGTTPERPVDQVFRMLPDRHPGVVAYIDIEASLRPPDGASDIQAPTGDVDWPRSYVDVDGTTVLLRKPDSWHFCPTGAQRLATAVNQGAADLGWAAVAPVGTWEQGDWRLDPRYDNPHGGCDQP